MAGIAKWSTGRKIGASVAGLVLVPVGLATTPPAAAAATQPTTATATATAPAAHKGGKLSPRLHALSQNPKARALSLPRSGPGSLLRHGHGRLVVQIRMSNLSA